MLVSRKELLRQLESTIAGLSTEGAMEQSDCFVFTPGFVTTFNDEVCCRHESVLDIRGAVQAKPLLESLRKWSEDEIDLSTTDSHVVISVKRRKSSVKMSQDIVLPVSVVDLPTEWADLPPAFGDALVLVAGCADKDAGDFPLNCVKIAPDHLEATDLQHAMRYKVFTGIQSEVLIRRSGCAALNGLGVAAVAETESWVHWKTYTGLILSARKWSGKYPDLETLYHSETLGKLVLPGSITESITRAAVFCSETATGKQVVIRLKPGKMQIESKNQNGDYRELKDIDYNGAPASFGLDPKYVSSIIKHETPCDITDSTLRVDGGNFIYCVALETIVE